jgi:hypothetical protein
MIARLATAAAASVITSVYAAGRVGVAATREAQRRAEPAPLPPPTPPRVAIHGFLHLDVVQHVDRGWLGTVHHTRVLGEATVRWHGTFATDALGDVAARLALRNRKIVRG